MFLLERFSFFSLSGDLGLKISLELGKTLNLLLALVLGRLQGRDLRARLVNGLLQLRLLLFCLLDDFVLATAHNSILDGIGAEFMFQLFQGFLLLLCL